jgi:hypothetical protein
VRQPCLSRVSGSMFPAARAHNILKAIFKGGFDMSMITKRYACACAVAFFVLLAAPRCAEAIRLEYSASQDGFKFKYRIPFFGFGRVALTGPNDQPQDLRLRFLFIKLATLQLSIASIDPDEEPPSLTVHYDLTPSRFLSRFVPEPLSGDIPVIFGEAGLRIKLFRKWFFGATGNDADMRVLLTRKKSKYAFDFDLPQLKGSWEDEANRQDNQIQQTITYDNVTFADINLTFTYMPAFVTKVAYSIKLKSNPLLPDNSTSFDGNVVLPNGSYYVWFNSVQ